VIVFIAGRGRARRVQEIARVTGFDAQGYDLTPPLVPDFPQLDDSQLPDRGSADPSSISER
jgi:type IV secretion system protein VirB11